MSKLVYVYTLLFVSYTFCKGQNSPVLTKGGINSESRVVVTSRGLTNMDVNRANFSGEWKLNESKSQLVGQFPLCIFGGGDRMRSKIMKIAEQADLITVDVASSSSDGALVVRQEKLTFAGGVIEATFVGNPREKSTASWSENGLTMTVNSIRSLDKNGEQADFKVTEVWKLINDGNSISIQVNSRAVSGENTMQLIYDRQRAADYRF
jgi:hypothetical protein